jgi:hypothetical protein
MTPAGLPVLRPREVAAILERLGFIEVGKSIICYFAICYP